jgi:hypothetical protein
MLARLHAIHSVMSSAEQLVRLASEPACSCAVTFSSLVPFAPLLAATGARLYC